jgi:hypothetical protein
MSNNEKTMWYVIVGLIFFWIVAIPVMMKGPKLAGAGPQPSSDGGGTGV